MNFWNLALSGWANRMLTPLLFFTLSFSLFAAAGRDWYTLLQEKNQPCELIVTAGEITEADAARFLTIESVLQATPVYQVPVTLKVDQIQLETILYGISGDYLTLIPDLGTIFPENPGMPCLFLNSSALKELAAEIAENKNEDTDASLWQTIHSYDWLNASVSIKLSENEWVVSRICGAGLPDSESDRSEKTAESRSPETASDSGFSESPRYYISISEAKRLLARSDSIAGPDEIHIRIASAGKEEAVTASLQEMGYLVENGDSARSADWKSRENHIFSTLVSAVISVLAAVALLRMELKLDLAVHGKEYHHLQQLLSGSPNLLARINRIRILLLLLSALLLSTLYALIIPLLFHPG